MNSPHNRARLDQARRRRPPNRRPHLERLEDRTLLDASLPRPVIDVNWQGYPARAFSNEWVVRFDMDHGSPAEQQRAAKALLGGLTGFEVVQHLGEDGLFLVRGPERGSFEGYTGLLRQLTTIDALEPNFLITAQFNPNDTRFGEQWPLRNTGQVIQGQPGIPNKDIDATDAWDFRAGGDRSVIVAVLDTGVDYTHPDLNDNIFVNPAEVAGNGIDDDDNGFIDDTRGWDFTAPSGGDNDPSDADGHGTHVAGIISAEGNNSQGVAGAAYGVRILPVKLMTSAGSGSTANAIAAVNYVNMMSDLGHDIRLSNNSFGTGSFSALLRGAIDEHEARGILFVTAAGNTGSNNDATPFFPGSYPNDNIIAVTATDNRDTLWDNSNFGLTTVDVAAPGENVLSTLPGGTYGFRSGTSMAAAHVAGAAAWLWSVHPSATYEEVRDALFQSVEPVFEARTNGTRPVATGGRPMMASALNLLTSSPLVIVEATAGSVSESADGNSNVGFIIKRTGDAADFLTVQFTLNGTAAGGVDYETITASVTMAPGENSAIVTILPIDDAVGEGNETVVLTLSTNSDYLVGAPKTATVIIVDNDAPTVTVVASDASAAEVNNPGEFTVTRSGPTTSAMTVNLTVGGTASGGADYTALPASVVIPAGASSATLTVSPVNDEVPEPAETVVLTLASGAGYAVGTPGTATVTIADGAGVNFPPDLQPIADRAVPASQLVVTVPLAATDPNGDTVTFTASAQSLAWVLTQQHGQFVYFSVYDNYYGANEKWFQVSSAQWFFLLSSGDLVLWDGSNAAAGTSLGLVGARYYAEPSALAGASANDPHAAVTISGSTLSVTREPAWDSALVVSVTASDGRGGTDSESFAVFVTTANLPTVTVTASDASSAESGDTGTFTITRSGPTTSPMLVTFTVGGTASGGADYTALPASVVIPAGASSATLTVSPVDDPDGEGIESVILTLGPGGYLAVAPKTATVVIIDNDVPTVTVVASDASAAEVNNTGTFTVTRTGSTASAMTVNLTVGGTATSGADYAALPTSVTIPAGSTSIIIVVNPVNDGVPEPAETVVLTLASGAGYAVGSPAAATVTILDGTGVNTPPVLQPIADRTVPASQLVVTVPLSATDPDGDTVTFTASAQSLAWVLTQQHGQFVYFSIYDNYYGAGEKWFQVSSGQWFGLLSSGELILWDGGNAVSGTSLGRIGARYYTDPSALQGASADDPHAAMTISGSTLTVTRELAWASSLVVSVIASDGRGGTDTESFTIFVSG